MFTSHRVTWAPGQSELDEVSPKKRSVLESFSLSYWYHLIDFKLSCILVSPIFQVL